MRIAAAGVVCALVSICSVAKADPFSLYSLQSFRTTSLQGIDAQGDVLTYVNSFTPAPLYGSTWTIQNPEQSILSTFASAPSFVHDDGAVCTPSLQTGFHVVRAACNGAYAIASIEDDVTDPGKTDYSLRFFGPQFATAGYVINTGFGMSVADNIKLNENGDFAIDNGYTEQQYEGFLTVAPEPSTMALLGTGAIGLCGVMRRRMEPCQADEVPDAAG